MTQIIPLGSPVIPEPIRLHEQLTGVGRCPHCSAAHPTLTRVWASNAGGTPRGDGGLRSKWAAYCCTTCGGVVSAQGVPGNELATPSAPKLHAIFPQAMIASELLPPMARTFLTQAIEVLHAPDAAAMVAGSAVDAMLKEKGYQEGSLYARIDQAKSDGLLTAGMADWAHSVRLGSNRPRHADAANPHVTPAEAKRSVDFAQALGNFLFVLSAQIAEATSAAENGG